MYVCMYEKERGHVQFEADSSQWWVCECGVTNEIDSGAWPKLSYVVPRKSYARASNEFCAYE